MILMTKNDQEATIKVQNVCCILPLKHKRKWSTWGFIVAKTCVAYNTCCCLTGAKRVCVCGCTCVCMRVCLSSVSVDGSDNNFVERQTGRCSMNHTAGEAFMVTTYTKEISLLLTLVDKNAEDSSSRNCKPRDWYKLLTFKSTQHTKREAKVWCRSGHMANLTDWQDWVLGIV